MLKVVVLTIVFGLCSCAHNSNSRRLSPSLTFKTKSIPNTKDKWIGDYNCPAEKSAAKYIKDQFKL